MTPRPSTAKLREVLQEFGDGSELLDDAWRELYRIEEFAIDTSHIDKAARDVLNAKCSLTDDGIARALGVKSLLRGTLKVKESSGIIYRGHTFSVLGLFCEWPSGTKEYLVSLLGTEFEDIDAKEKGYVTTTICSGDIETVDVKPWSVEKTIW